VVATHTAPAMSLQWTLVAACMYAELALTILMLLPLISAKRWHSFFKSRFLASFVAMSGIYFKIFFGILVLCCLDALREMHKYGGSEASSGHSHEHGVHLDVEMQAHMRLFRAQRNFYISGFALVLAGVLYRLTTLLSTLASSQAEAEAAMKQAKSASDAAQLLLNQNDEGKGEAKKVRTEEHAKMKELTEENLKLKAENAATLKQAEGVRREYDRLLEEHAGLQGKTDKKDD